MVAQEPIPSSIGRVEEEGRNSTKTSFLHTYGEPTPLAYYKSLTPLGYGIYHDQLAQLLEGKLREGVRRVIDIGCLYGSTTLAYARGAKWGATLHPDPVSDLEVTGVDLSEPALRFGMEVSRSSKG